MKNINIIKEQNKYQFEFKGCDFKNLKNGESKFLSDLTEYSKTFSDLEQLKDYVKFLFKL